MHVIRPTADVLHSSLEGTIATDPAEIDSIIRRMWKKVYDGNPMDLRTSASKFVAKYSGYIYTATEFEIQPMTAEELESTCTSCSHSAHGPDGFEPAEMALLCTDAYGHIADLLNLIEEGAEWPQGAAIARAAFLEKGPGQARRSDEC